MVCKLNYSKKKFFLRGQNLTELALIVGMLGLIVIGMQVYIKRSVQGKVKDLSDAIIGQQEPYPTDTSSLVINTATTNTSSNSETGLKNQIGGSRDFTVKEKTTIDYISESQSK